ncbi:MAG: hypothetical protein EOO04_10715 [Chitinophagaceae bacterium]|nr:MAG: hypothetical protein EOO04_10715 [Chitinophagaceae bacterium]
MGVYGELNKLYKCFRKVLLLSLLTVVSFALPGCGNGDDHPDVSNIKVELRSARLDKGIAGLDTTNLEAGLTRLKQQFPGFLDFYIDTLMGFGVYGDYSPLNPGIRKGLGPFLAHPDIRGLLDTVAAHYPDTKAVDDELQKGFQYLRHYYPDRNVPKVIYLVSGLNKWYVFTVDTSFIGVGLDMYLGENYPYYASVQIPQYSLSKCRPEYIPVNVFQAIYRDMYPFLEEDRSLLDLMIQRGKEQYFLSKVVPFAADTTRLGYTAGELAWCESSEGQIFNFFASKNLLYEKSVSKTVRFINDGPNAAGMPPESPGNVGTWLGWRIVQAYVKEHPGVPMEELFKDTDAQRFLQESRYKPAN